MGIRCRTTAQALVAWGKGILAMDESNGTCNKRFEALGIPATEDYRRTYRQMILISPQLSDYISGPILYQNPSQCSAHSRRLGGW